MNRLFRALFGALIIVALAGRAEALDTPIMLGGTQLPSTSATNYTHPFGNLLTWNATENTQRGVIPVAGTGRSFYAAVTTAPSSGKSWAFTLVKNGVDTLVTCTISNTATSCNDLADTISLSAGDTLSLKSVPSGTPTSPGQVLFGWIFRSSSNEGPILGSGRSTAISPSATNYLPLMGASTPNATLNLRDQVLPTGGAVDKLYVELDAAPGSGKSFAFTVLKNGSSTGVTCTVADTATTCSDTSNSVSFAAGDTVALQSVPSGTPGTSLVRYGTRWVPTTPGETIVLYSSGNAPNNAGATRYAPPGGTSNTWQTAEAGTQVIVPGAFTWRTWRIAMNTDPGGAATYTFRNRVNTANGAMSVVVSGGSTTGSDTSNSDAVVAGDLLAVQCVSASSPASSVPKWGMVLMDEASAATPTPTPTNTPTNTPTATPTATPTPTNTPTPEPTVAARLLAATGVGR